MGNCTKGLQILSLPAPIFSALLPVSHLYSLTVLPGHHEYHRDNTYCDLQYGESMDPVLTGFGMFWHALSTIVWSSIYWHNVSCKSFPIIYSQWSIIFVQNSHVVSEVILRNCGIPDRKPAAGSGEQQPSRSITTSMYACTGIPSMSDVDLIASMK